MALEGGEGSASQPGHSLPQGKTRYPLYRRLGGPQVQSGQVRKFLPPPGLDPRTAQPVDNRYIDRATRPTRRVQGRLKIHKMVHDAGSERKKTGWNREKVEFVQDTNEENRTGFCI